MENISRYTYDGIFKKCFSVCRSFLFGNIPIERKMPDWDACYTVWWHFRIKGLVLHLVQFLKDPQESPRIPKDSRRIPQNPAKRHDSTESEYCNKLNYTSLARGMDRKTRTAWVIWQVAKMCTKNKLFSVNNTGCILCAPEKFSPKLTYPADLMSVHVVV